MKLKTQTDNKLGVSETLHEVYETGQLRRAEMHTFCLIKALNGEKVLTPALCKLIEASLVLNTTNSEILATCLGRSRATIRSEFQQILAILGDHYRNSGLCPIEDEDSKHIQVGNRISPN